MTINNTNKTNWVQILDYESDEPEINIRINSINSICLLYFKGILGVEIHTTHNNQKFFFGVEDNEVFKKVDSVNGVTPISIDDLKLKLMDLL